MTAGMIFFLVIFLILFLIIVGEGVHQSHWRQFQEWTNKLICIQCSDQYINQCVDIIYRIDDYYWIEPDQITALELLIGVVEWKVVSSNFLQTRKKELKKSESLDKIITYHNMGPHLSNLYQIFLHPKR